MQSTRQNKISRLIQQDLGDIFLREMKPVLGNSLITVTGVRITPDLSIARVYVSIMPIGTIPAYRDRQEEPASKASSTPSLPTAPTSAAVWDCARASSCASFRNSTISSTTPSTWPNASTTS